MVSRKINLSLRLKKHGGTSFLVALISSLINHLKGGCWCVELSRFGLGREKILEGEMGDES